MILRVAAPRLGANLPTLHMAGISPVIRSPARMGSIVSLTYLLLNWSIKMKGLIAIMQSLRGNQDLI